MSRKKKQEKDFKEVRISIAGISDSRRKDRLKSQKRIKSGQGWRFVSYHNDGMNSYAVFLVPQKKIPWGIIVTTIVIITIIVIAIILFPGLDKKSGKSEDASPGVKVSRPVKETPSQATQKRSNSRQESAQTGEQQKKKKKGNALAWQKASRKEKMVACKTLVKAMWKQKMLKNRIQKMLKSEEDLKPYSEALLNALNKAFKKDPDPIKNQRMFEYENITPTAVRLARLMGWLK